MEKKITTKNNIDIYTYPNHHTHSFCLSLYVKAGCIYECAEENGITHFMEHIVFRNANYLMEGKLYETIDKLGLYFNGATYKEFMQLYIIGAPEHFGEAIELLLKVFQPIKLPAKEIKTEQQRVKAEIREADEFKSLDYFAGTHVWKGTSLENTILGTRKNIDSFGKKKVSEQHQQLFTDQNLFFYLTGNAGDNDLETLKTHIEAIDFPKAQQIRDNVAPIPDNFGHRNGDVQIKNSQYTVVQFSFDIRENCCSGAELMILYDILFSGDNCLMHQELSEKRGLVYGFSSTLEKYRNIGRIYFTFEVAPRSIDESIELVVTSLKTLRDTVEDRMACVRAEYIDNAYMVYDNNEDFNWQRAYENHILNEGYEDIEGAKKVYAAVTAARIKEIAEDIFTADNLILSIKGNKKKLTKERMERILKI